MICSEDGLIFPMERGDEMTATVKISIAPEEIIRAVRGMKPKQRRAFLEDLLAAVSPEYLASIREGRADYKAGRVKSHAELFGK